MSAEDFRMSALAALSPANRGGFNLSLARALGSLEAAVYWDALSFVLWQVMKKGKYDPQGFFLLDRGYVEEKTTMTPEQQRKCDRLLVDAGYMLVDESNPDRLCVDSSGVLALIVDGDYIDTVDKAKAAALKDRDAAKKATKKEAKRLGMVSGLSAYVVEPDEDLKVAYKRWIEALVSGSRINHVTVETFVSTIQAAKLDKQTTLYVIGKCAANFWKDAAYAIKICVSEIAKNPSLVAPQRQNPAPVAQGGGTAF